MAQHQTGASKGTRTQKFSSVHVILLRSCQCGCYSGGAWASDMNPRCTHDDW